MQSLTSAVLERRIDALTDWIVERYETVVSDDHVVEIMCDLGLHFNPKSHGEHYLEARLRNRLRDKGYFERMLGEPTVGEHVSWNEMHWPWENGLADDIVSARCEADAIPDPKYVRSRLPKTLAKISPINRVAARVLPPEEEMSEAEDQSGE